MRGRQPKESRKARSRKESTEVDPEHQPTSTGDGPPTSEEPAISELCELKGIFLEEVEIINGTGRESLLVVMLWHTSPPEPQARLNYTVKATQWVESR